MGTATAMPSGMLWIAMAATMGTATMGSSSAAMNVAKPSGKLCKASATAVSTPAFIILRLRASPAEPVTVDGSCGLISSGTNRSMTAMSATPPKKAATAAHGPTPPPQAAERSATPLGKISTKET